jgi:hypothetical protein
MADVFLLDKRQSLDEVRQWDFDFSAELEGAATISSATAEHFPPSGAAATPTVGTIVSGVVPVRLGPLTVTGNHRLSVLATHSDGAKSEAQILFAVLDL